jgi:hypothetical protein
MKALSCCHSLTGNHIGVYENGSHFATSLPGWSACDNRITFGHSMVVRKDHACIVLLANVVVRKDRSCIVLLANVVVRIDRSSIVLLATLDIPFRDVTLTATEVLAPG